MKVKQTGIFIMISSIYWTFYELFLIIQRLIGESANYWTENITAFFGHSLIIIVPISLFILGLQQLCSESITDSNNNKETNKTTDNYNSDISIGEWFLFFFITIMPLVGLVFLIVWANDDKNKTKRNWAITSLIWMGIIAILGIFIYILVFTTLANNYNIFYP